MAVDGNHIDAMFVDQRDNRSSGNGQKLVCVCGGGGMGGWLFSSCGGEGGVCGGGGVCVYVYPLPVWVGGAGYV